MDGVYLKWMNRTKANLKMKESRDESSTERRERGSEEWRCVDGAGTEGISKQMGRRGG